MLHDTFFKTRPILDAALKTSTSPQGQILSPRPGEITTHEVSVTGKTSNIEPGQYIWLAVDKPELELTWPKMFMSEPNIHFRTTIFEGGPPGLYSLSLYVVTQDTHEQWTAWLKAGKLGGLHMPPKKRRLTTVRLMKEGRT